MKKQTVILIVTAAVFAAALVLTFVMLRKPAGTLVEIVQDGTVIRTVDLNNAENQRIRVDSPDGTSYNIVTVENGEIRVSEAGCPDQTCVRSGVLRSDYMPIVCLPNRLIVRYAE